jgi:hypothetical protein
VTEVSTQRSYRERVVPFVAGDGMQLNLIHVRGQKEPSRGPVLLVHGAGVRANIFRPPVATSLVDVLVADGYDVWLENWRASIDFPPSLWTLDQAARYDHPSAVQTVLRETGARTTKAIIHCQGSTSFTMSAVAGLVPDVDVVISNAVSLHPVVPSWSKIKLGFCVPLVRLFIDHLNPHWGVRTEGLVSWLLTALTRLSHHECNNTVCKLVSFAYGAGRPALWSHKTISSAVHDWLKEEFGFVPLRFHAQMHQCVRHQALLGAEELPGLPHDFVAEPPRTAARFAFFAGENNLCFLAESQRRSFAYFDALESNRHSLHVIPGYGHLDIFLGEHAARDVFPQMLGELARASSIS